MIHSGSTQPKLLPLSSLYKILHLASAALWLLLLPACEQAVQQEVNLEVFRSQLAGKWVQMSGRDVTGYMELTADGKVLDADGKTIGGFEPDGAQNRVVITQQGKPEIRSGFHVAARGKSLSFTEGKGMPFTKASFEQVQQAKLVQHRPHISANLDRLIDEADAFRARTGQRRVTYADLVGPGKAIEGLPIIAGEDYSHLVLEGESLLRVQTSYGMEVLAQE